MNRPIDIVQAMLSSLKPAELDQLKLQLGVVVQQSPCQKVGHKYKPLDKVTASWFHPGRTRLYCPACGDILVKEDGK